MARNVDNIDPNINGTVHALGGDVFEIVLRGGGAAFGVAEVTADSAESRVTVWTYPHWRGGSQYVPAMVKGC
jgi:hypothetical protein